MTVFKIVAGFSAFFLLFIGPWPVDDTPFLSTEYAEKTFSHILNIKSNRSNTPLFANAIKIEIPAIPNTPLAGYSARESKNNTGSLDKIFAKALTLANNENKVTILSAEILLPLKELVDAILLKTQLERNDIFFMATHTHSGPGGYAHGIIEEISLGKFTQQQFIQLVDVLSEAILQSRKHLQPAQITYSRTNLSAKTTKQFISNQLSEKTPAHNSIHTLEVLNSDNNTRIATLISFSAHPTLLGRINHKISGDYPSKLTDVVENKLGGIVIFSAGAVGAMLPIAHSKKIEDAKIQIEKRNRMGVGLGNIIIESLLDNKRAIKDQYSKNIMWRTISSSIQAEIIPVYLPYPNYRINDHLRLSPLFINSFFHNNMTYIQTLKIGKLVLLSYPADYAGELAADLENWGDKNSIYPWAMSFNGDYIGYVMPSKYYDLNHYVVRDVNFYGRWSGDYLKETSKRIIKQLQ